MMNTKRDRAWRRRQRAVKIQHRQTRQLGGQAPPVRGRFAKVKGYPSYRERGQNRPSKDWKLLYWRSRKLKRAAQLGLEYPRKSWLDLLLEWEKTCNIPKC